MPRFLSLALPRWPIQRWSVALEPDRSEPMLLYQESQRGLRIADCCPTASRQGVSRGMSLTEAMSLAKRDTAAKLRITKYDPVADRQALRQLALECEPFSPVIGLDEIDPPAGLLFDVTGVAKHFDGEAALAESLVEHLRRRGYSARVAIAETIGVAWGVSRFGESRIECIDAGDPRAQRLPVEALRLSPAAVATLNSLGVHSIEQLTQLPRRQLRSRFGDHLLTRLWQWRGEIPELIQPIDKPLEIAAEITLEYVTSDRQAVAYLLDDPLTKVVAELIDHGLGAMQLECRLKGETGESQTLKIGFLRPCDDAPRMRQLLRLQLESVVVPDGVQSIRLRVVESRAQSAAQTKLFGNTRLATRELDKLVNQLSTRLGEDNVTRAWLREDHQPEFAYRETAAIHSHVASNSHSSGCQFQAGDRPVVLIDPPAPVSEVTLDNRDLPREFVFRQRREQVALSSAAETIETAWWRGPTVRRDYHRVRTESGMTLWLFRQHEGDHWFVQGEFF